MSDNATVPMLAPDGSSGDMPSSSVPDAIQAGFTPAVALNSPDGKLGYVPAQRLNEALKAKFTPANPNSEGTYKMVGPNGSISVPYSNVEAAKMGGYAVAGEDSDRYDKDSTPKIGLQKSFDINTSTRPDEPLGATALKSVVHGAGQMFVHPLDTLAGAAHLAGQAVTGNATGAAAEMATPIVQDYQDAGGGGKGTAYAATKFAGTAFGNMAAGETVAPILGRAAEFAPQEGIVPASSAAVRSVGHQLLPSIVDGPTESLLTRGIKPGKNNVNWNADIQTAAPLIKSAEQQLGHPIQGVDDALTATNLAKKQVWQQYQQRLGPAAAQGAVIDGNQIADAMMNSIDARTAAQNPGLIAKVKATADTYRRPIPLSQAEDFLQSANKDLTNYYAKNKVGQQVAQNDPEMASTVAEGNALRAGLYNKLDQLTGPGAAQIKQAYGSLSNVEKELTGRQLVAARQNPESLSEQLSTVAGAGKIVKGIVTASPGDILEGAQNIGVSRALKARNSSDEMITRAFAKAKPASPFPQPTFRPVAGLLPAQAQGNQLPYYPQMTPDEQLVAFQHALRQSMPLKALPAKVQPIPLPPPQ